ncbi:MAG: shikimate kinase [Bifidobacteriaceae bacterium]|jgi:shikimate kinase|nr:shikimate kinase [Bifidobacteriaceae bacterium]
MNQVIALIGSPGAGKTTVGQCLAGQLAWPFLDTDQVVEQMSGRSVADIFTADGEAQFRRIERQAVHNCLTVEQGARVVALGGGAVLDMANRADLAKEPMVVYLEVAEDTAMARVGLAASRPLLAVSPRARWRTLMAERRPIYQSLADLSLSTDQLTPTQAAERIISHFGLPTAL